MIKNLISNYNNILLSDHQKFCLKNKIILQIRAFKYTKLFK